MLSFSLDLTQIILMTLFSTYSCTYLYLMSNCLVHDMVIILLAINLASTLSLLPWLDTKTKFSCFKEIEWETSLHQQPWIRLHTTPLSWKVTHFSVTFIIKRLVCLSWNPSNPQPKQWEMDRQAYFGRNPGKPNPNIRKVRENPKHGK